MPPSPGSFPGSPWGECLSLPPQPGSLSTWFLFLPLESFSYDIAGLSPASSKSVLRLGLCLHMAGKPVPAPLRRQEKPGHTPGLPPAGPQVADVLPHMQGRAVRMGLLSGASSALFLGLVLGPFPLLAHQLALLSFSSCWIMFGSEILEEKHSPYHELFLPPRVVLTGATPTLFLSRLALPTPLPAPSVPLSLALWGLRVCAQVPCLAPVLPVWCPHSCNPVTTTGAMTHSWPGSQWCKKEQNVPRPRPVPCFPGPLPALGKVRGGGEESGKKRTD